MLGWNTSECPMFAEHLLCAKSWAGGLPCLDSLSPVVISGGPSLEEKHWKAYQGLQIPRASTACHQGVSLATQLGSHCCQSRGAAGKSPHFLQPGPHSPRGPG